MIIYLLDVLLGVAKIQILKVVHNSIPLHKYLHSVVSNHKDTNFESNSQHIEHFFFRYHSCWESQKYKFCK